jgi:shikimate dehydrogenase
LVVLMLLTAYFFRHALRSSRYVDTSFEVMQRSNKALEEANRALVEQRLVINATGLGKDRPGSPITDAARFPERGIAWELNYRGDLRFQRQAEAQARERGLRVEDGWRYFIHGWSEVVAEAFHLELTPGLLDRLSEAASP